MTELWCYPGGGFGFGASQPAQSPFGGTAAPFGQAPFGQQQVCMSSKGRKQYRDGSQIQPCIPIFLVTLKLYLGGNCAVAGFLAFWSDVKHGNFRRFPTSTQRH